jgi:hypothetical protein
MLDLPAQQAGDRSDGNLAALGTLEVGIRIDTDDDDSPLIKLAPSQSVDGLKVRGMPEAASVFIGGRLPESGARTASATRLPGVVH